METEEIAFDTGSGLQQVSPVFETYQKARLQFAQSVADLASKPTANEALKTGGAVPLLCSLIFDVVPAVQRTALLALGRLSSNNIKIAEEIVKRNLLPLLIDRLRKENTNLCGDRPTDEQLYKSSAAFVLRSIAKHNKTLAEAIIEKDGLEAIKVCIKESDPLIKESAIWTIANIAKHSEDLAWSIVSEDLGFIPMLIISLSEYDLRIVRVAISAIYEISKHSEPLCQLLMLHNVVPAIDRLLDCEDIKLKRLLIPTLTQLSRHSDELAVKIATESRSIEIAIRELSHENPGCRRNCAVYLLECIKHTDELTQRTIQAGSIAKMVEYIQTHQCEDRIPGVMFLGNLATKNDDMANAVIFEQGVLALCTSLDTDTNPEVREISAWTLGYLGSYSPSHAEALCEADAVTLLAVLALKSDTPVEVKTKCTKSLKMVLEQCMDLETLDIILADAPNDILNMILNQYIKILKVDGKARSRFITSGSFRRVQQLSAKPGSETAKAIRSINYCFPPEVIQYYTSGYFEDLLKEVENFQPPPDPHLNSHENRKRSEGGDSSDVISE
ncbi:sperm-associated antigen 6-like [Centruroides sculpturatus]|uniref:sperm-associated antigen 6-like n=1 Tax=Centruroides sculpturatus TaxID=218467 RepID=UPI000C6DA340|nr:sperm-associated antigen 6-like [Centruroides sculpturatus]